MLEDLFVSDAMWVVVGAGAFFESRMIGTCMMIIWLWQLHVCFSWCDAWVNMNTNLIIAQRSNGVSWYYWVHDAIMHHKQWFTWIWIVVRPFAFFEGRIVFICMMIIWWSQLHVCFSLWLVWCLSWHDLNLLIAQSSNCLSWFWLIEQNRGAMVFPNFTYL